MRLLFRLFVLSACCIDGAAIRGETSPGSCTVQLYAAYFKGILAVGGPSGEYRKVPKISQILFKCTLQMLGLVRAVAGFAVNNADEVLLVLLFALFQFALGIMVKPLSEQMHMLMARHAHKHLGNNGGAIIRRARNWLIVFIIASPFMTIVIIFWVCFWNGAYTVNSLSVSLLILVGIPLALNAAAQMTLVILNGAFQLIPQDEAKLSLLV